MVTAAELLRGKAHTVASLPPTAMVGQAVQLMHARQIGSVLVIEDDRLIGIFTERDLLSRVAAAERHPSVTTLSEVMSSPVACASPQTGIDEMRHFMREHRIRHLPVIDDRDRVLGIVSMRDLIRAEREVLEHTIRDVNHYINSA